MQKSTKRSTKSARSQRSAKRNDSDTVTYGPLIRNPFPDQYYTQLHINLPVSIRTTSSTPTDTFALRINGPLQVDFTNALGYNTRVPALFPYLCAADATGPYRRYRVVGWDCKYTFINDSVYPLDCFVSEDELPTDLDTLGELYAESQLNRVTLDAKGGGTVSKSLRIVGNADRSTPAIVDGSYEFGTYNTNPTQGLYHNFLMAQISSPCRYFVAVDITLRVVFFDRRVTRNV